MKSFCVTLPIKTHNPLNCAQGTTMRAMYARARERKEQRSLAFMVVRGAIDRARVRIPVVITLTRIAPSSGLDDDAVGPALKAVRDGITDALGLKNDRDERLTWRYAQRRGRRFEYGVEVLVEERMKGIK